MKGILLFDIDKTIFDRDSFLGDFYKLFESKVIIENIYEENKKEFGHFNYKKFLVSIIKNYPELEQQITLFFDTQNIKKYVFDDSNVLYKISNHKLGIWSKGDPGFQKQKIANFKDILDEDLIYIYQNKIEKFHEVISKNTNSKICIVDDSLEALEAAKEVDKNVVAILLDREMKYEGDKMKIDFRLESLSDIIQVLK